MRPSQPRSPSARAHRLAGACAVLLATALALPACSSSSASGSGSASVASSGSAEAAKGPPPEVTLFAASRSILADLPVLKLVPKDTLVVLAARDPATVVAKLGALSGFADAKDPLAKEIDDAAKDISKDLPDLAALAANGVDLSKPAGVLWTDPELDTSAIFAAVSDEAAMKKWLEDRAKQSNGRRELVALGDAVVLRAKRDVTRAVVLRKGFVFWVRSREGYDLDPKRITSVAEGLAQTAEADSLGADATFTKTLGQLAYGAQASLFVNAGRFTEGLVAARTKTLEATKKAFDDASAALAEAEKKKKKSATEEAKYAAESAERAFKTAEVRAKQVEVLGLLKDEVPALALGIDLDDRDVRVKAFVAMPKPGAVKLFAPLEGPSAVLDASLGAQSAGRFAIDPRVLDFLAHHLGVTSIGWGALPVERAKSALLSLGVDMKELSALFDGEVSAAKHRQKTEPLAAPADDAGTPDAGAEPPAPRDVDGYSVVWHLSDAPKASTLLETAWGKLATTDRATKGQVKHPAPAALDQQWRPDDLIERVRIVGSSLVVTTHPAFLEALADTKPRPTWMTAAEQPTLKQLAGIEGATAIVAFDGITWRQRGDRGLWGAGSGRSRSDILREAAELGMIGSLFGAPASKKTKKLEEERSKLRDQLRELEKALDKQKSATWDAFAARLGTTALFAKPAEGGVAIYGGLFSKEASLSALAEAAIGAWMSVGPRWEKWGEMADLKKKIQAIDDKLEAERVKAMDDMVGDVLRGLGASDRAGSGGHRFGAFDDDLGSLLGGADGMVGTGGLGGGTRGGGTGDVTGIGLGGIGTTGRGGGGVATPATDPKSKKP